MTSPKACDEGYALVEAAVEIVLVTLVMAIIAFAVGSGLRALGHFRVRSLESAKVTLFARASLEAALSVAVPFFESPEWHDSVEETGRGDSYRVSLPWAGGKKESTVLFGNDAKGAWLVPSPLSPRLSLPGYSLFLERDRSGRPFAVRMVGKDSEILFPLGSQPESYSPGI